MTDTPQDAERLAAVRERIARWRAEVDKLHDADEEAEFEGEFFLRLLAARDARIVQLDIARQEAELNLQAAREENAWRFSTEEHLRTALAKAEAARDRLADILRFDPTEYPGMEAAAIEWCAKLRRPDPVGLLEAAEAMAQAALAPAAPERAT